MANKKWLKCKRCGTVDASFPGHVGTSVKMKCSSCTGLCRRCCPTEHGTLFETRQVIMAQDVILSELRGEDVEVIKH